ncbi:MAG: hypothetical protein WCP35_15380 [Verrucomicrobiota bacterium]
MKAHGFVKQMLATVLVALPCSATPAQRPSQDDFEYHLTAETAGGQERV